MKRTTLSGISPKRTLFSQMTSGWSKKVIAAEVISISLITLFAYAAISKLLEYDSFVTQISESPILKSFSKPLAIFVPAIELITCLLLIIPKSRLLGLYASFILMLAFTIYIAAILTLSAEVPCSCGGVLELLGWKSHLIFNLVFTALAFIGTRLDKQLRKATI